MNFRLLTWEVKVVYRYTEYVSIGFIERLVWNYHIPKCRGLHHGPLRVLAS